MLRSALEPNVDPGSMADVRLVVRCAGDKEQAYGLNLGLGHFLSRRHTRLFISLKTPPLFLSRCRGAAPQPACPGQVQLLHPGDWGVLRGGILIQGRSGSRVDPDPSAAFASR